MPAIRETGPGRLEIREGGGRLTLFGLPFFATGTLMLLARFGVFAMHSDGEPVRHAAMVLLGVLFTLVGGVLAFGRAVTAIDVGQHVITKQWRILVPVRTWNYQLGDYTTVTLAFVRGDSDSADKYPIGLKGNTVATLPLCSPTQYAEAYQCATAVARHLGLDIEDTSTDHPSRVPASELDAGLRDRLRSAGSTAAAVARPPVLTSEVSDDSGTVRIAIPTPPLHPLAIVAGLFPAVVAMGLLGWLGLLSSPRPLTPAERIFFGVLFVGFALLPAISVVERWLKSRLSRTIVTISTEELRVQQRGIFRTRTITALRASEILDVDYSTKESVMTSARRSAKAETSTMGQITPSSSTGPNTEWVFAILSRFLKGKGIVVKSRTGLTTFGEGLADDEIRYLHALIQRALAGGAA